MRTAVTWSGPGGRWSIPALHGGDATRRLHGQTMGTTWSVVLGADAPHDDAALHAAVQRALDAVVEQMSPWREDSAISRFNAAPAGSTHVVPDAFATVLGVALEIARISDGTFDPTTGALVDAWGFGPPGPVARAPDDATLAHLLAASGIARLAFDRHARTVTQPGGLRLDLSAIAKGFGVDQAVEALQAAGVRDALVEVGGELRALGRRPDGTPWTVSIEHPDGGAAFTRVRLTDRAIATSGDYRRVRFDGDMRIAHTLDPRTGRPVTHALASATVLHASAMHADALATALMVLGPEAGLAFANRHGLAALLVTRTPGGTATRATPAFIAAQASP